MIKKLTLYTFLSAFAWIDSQSQNTSQIWLKAQIVSPLDSLPIPFAQIVSYKNLVAYAADSTGRFNISFPADDSIKIVALGFESSVFKLTNSISNTGDIINFPLEKTNYLIAQVDILNNSIYNKYRNELVEAHTRAQEMNLNMPADIKIYKPGELPKRDYPLFDNKPTIMGSIFNPYNFMKYNFSKKEKIKRKLLTKFYAERNIVKTNRKMIEMASGLRGSKLEKFIIYCNRYLQLSTVDTEAIAIGKIQLLHGRFPI